jgi:hypothetical protein
MPFTPAHAAVSLPFIRRMRAFSVFGLVIGSMAPDFEYFLRLKPAALGGHTPLGFFMLNLPLSILVAVLYMNFIEDGLIQLMPNWVAKKWPRFGRNIKTYAIAEWLNFIFWTLVGMLTHIGLDSFTHSTGFFVRLFPVLKEAIFLGNLSIPVYKALQHGGTLFGLVTLAVYIGLRKPRKRMPKDCCNLIYFRISFFLLTAVLMGVRLALRHDIPLGLGEIIVSTISFSCVSLLVLSLILKKHDRQAVEEFLPS